MADLSLSTRGRLDLNATAIGEFLRQSDGPVMRKMMEVGEAVKLATIQGLKEGFPRDFLSPWIVKRVQMMNDGPHVIVGTDHVKTAPHRIDGNPTLAFPWKKMGTGMSFFRFVNHPGSDFTAYVEKTILEATMKVRLL